MRYRDRDNNLYVCIHDRCFDHWKRYQQRYFWQVERGGLLFAKSIGTTDGNVSVVEVTGPSRRDRAGRCRLELNHSKVIKEIANQFSKQRHFVGYWHTHPEPEPTLSGLDFRAFVDNLASEGLALARMIAVIVGNAEVRRSTAVYVVNTTRPEKLHVVPCK